MNRLQVFRTIIAVYAFLWRERRRFVTLAFPGVLVLGTMWALYWWYFLQVLRQGGQSNAISFLVSYGLAVWVLSSVFWVMFSVAWHRNYLVPDESVTLRAALRWGRRQTRFLLNVILIALVLLPVGLALKKLGSLVAGLVLFDSEGVFIGVPPPLIHFGRSVLTWLLVGLPTGVFAARLSLLFPAAAVDQRMSFRESWELTRENGWRLFLTASLATVPIWAIRGVVVALIGFGYYAFPFPLGLSDSWLQFSVVIAPINQAFAFVGIAAGVSALSIAYRDLRTRGQEPDSLFLRNTLKVPPNP